MTTPILVFFAALPAVAYAKTPSGPIRHEIARATHGNTAVIAIIERITGPSWIRRKGQGQQLNGSLGERLYEGDLLATDRSRLHVRYKDGTYVEMGEESEFQVERLRFKPVNLLPAVKASDQFDESVFRFLHGVVRVTAPDIHELEHFTIKTTNAIVKVTGPCDFYLIQLVNARDLTVRVIKGKLDLINAVTNERLSVPEGTGAYLRVSGMVTPAGPFNDEQLLFLKSRTRI